MCLSVGEDEVDSHADDGEEEYHETPDQLVHGRTVGFQNLDYSTIVSHHIVIAIFKQGGWGENELKTMMSRTRTMNPMIPPPVPYCQGVALVTVIVSSAMGAAATRAARQSWKKRGTVAEIMISNWLACRCSKVS